MRWIDTEKLMEATRLTSGWTEEGLTASPMQSINQWKEGSLWRFWAYILCIRASGEERQRDGYHERRNVNSIQCSVRRNVAEAHCRYGAVTAAEGHLSPQQDTSIVFR